MKRLLIIANPSKSSFSHALAAGYAENHDNCEVLDLYELGQDFLRYESISELKKGNDSSGGKRDLVQDKIKAADELVFFFPIWWGGMPAILKNFFDLNFSAGFAFNFLKGGKIEKLLTDKQAKVFCHCDAPGFIYKIPFILGINMKWYISRAILGFCGIKVTQFQLFDSISMKKTPEQREKIISTI